MEAIVYGPSPKSNINSIKKKEKIKSTVASRISFHTEVAALVKMLPAINNLLTKLPEVNFVTPFNQDSEEYLTNLVVNNQITRSEFTTPANIVIPTRTAEQLTSRRTHAIMEEIVATIGRERIQEMLDNISDILAKYKIDGPDA